MTPRYHFFASTLSGPQFLTECREQDHLGKQAMVDGAQQYLAAIADRLDPIDSFTITLYREKGEVKSKCQIFTSTSTIFLGDD